MAAPLFHIRLDVGAPIDVGIVAGSQRRCIPILGGEVSGRWNGTVLPGGADWQQIGPDGTIDIDARYVLLLAEGMVEVESRGLRSGPPEVLARLARGEAVDPSDYYFRTAMRFRTSSPALSPLGRLLGLARGERSSAGVILTVEEVA